MPPLDSLQRGWPKRVFRQFPALKGASSYSPGPRPGNSCKPKNSPERTEYRPPKRPLRPFGATDHAMPIFGWGLIPASLRPGGRQSTGRRNYGSLPTAHRVPEHNRTTQVRKFASGPAVRLPGASRPPLVTGRFVGPLWAHPAEQLAPAARWYPAAPKPSVRPSSPEGS